MESASAGATVFTPTILDHFQNPRNTGELSAPAVTVEATNPACGDIMRLSVVVENKGISDARFKTRGCVPAIAAGSILTEMIKGKSVAAAQALTAEEISLALEGLPPASSHAAVLAIDALKSALNKAAAATR